ncbi:MAG: TonB-dependent receptor [Bacteroidota bacterium]
MRTQGFLLMAASLLIAFSTPAKSADKPIPPASDPGVQFRVTVSDAEENIPIELARVVLRKNDKFLAQDATNPAGQVRFRDIEPGKYSLTVWFVGYITFSDSILIDEQHTSYTVALRSEGTEEQEVKVVAERELGTTHLDLKSGNQVFESETYHVAPTARMTNLIQQSLMGVARAPTGEVHIRGMHGEFTYYIDGLPVPLGVFGGLNEVVDPKVIDRATFVTGGFPAEFGGQMSAIVDLNNRVPTGSFHLDASTYAGSYLVFNGTEPFSPGLDVPSGASSSVVGDTLGGRVGPFRALNSNGQNLSISDHIGKLGFFVSGSRQETDRRIDSPVPNLFHDHGFDSFVYGKFDYVLSDIDYLTANLNFGRTNTEVPYDPVEQIASDQQKTTNGYQGISYFRILNADIDRESNLFIGAYARQGGLLYTPGDIDPPIFQFVGDTTRNYLVTEDRSFNTLGVRSTYDSRLSHELMYKVGFNFSSTTGTEQFTSQDSLNNPGPSLHTNFTGSDFGAFAETNWEPLEWTSFDLGVRYDQHIAPDVPLQRQVSPRIRWNFLIDANNSAYLYYGRLFMPTNIEGLRSIAINVSTSLTPTLPERDNFYEAVYTHNFPSGLRSKLAAFYKDSSPGLDDQTVGNTAIKTPVNIETVKITGVELGLSFSSPSTPFSGYVNSSIIHAYGSGAITGGFLDIDNAGSATDLDHDQRLSIVAGLNYQPQDWFVNLVGIYGSGLTNGNPDNAPYQTGLFDFNTATHTTPSWILNFSAGHTFHLAGGVSFEPSLYITNLLDHEHLIKGAYFSGASWEERRNVVLRVSLHV